MPFLPPNQHRQSTEGMVIKTTNIIFHICDPGPQFRVRMTSADAGMLALTDELLMFVRHPLISCFYTFITPSHQ